MLKAAAPLSSFLAVLSFIAVFIFASPVMAKANPKYASIVMDADTGMLLHQRYADKSLHPASLTKVMTLLLTFEALEQGRVRLSDRVRISRRAASMVPSKLGLPVGSSIRLEDAIMALTTKSANDIAVALAEHINGTESRFAREMTRKARSLGMTRTVFKNASGLHHRAQVSTVRDMAKLARTVIYDYPQYYRYFGRKSFTYKGKTYRNHNKLLGKYRGMDGMKTGYIQAAGFNLVASAVRNNRRLIGVVFGGRSGKTRNAHMASLLDRGFSRLKHIRMASARVPLPERKPGALLASVLDPASQDSAKVSTKWTGRPHEAFSDPSSVRLAAALHKPAFEHLIGEGDIDPAVKARIQTGLLAVAAHKGVNGVPLLQQASYQARPYLTAPNKAKSKPGHGWAIQVGAYEELSAVQSRLRHVRNQMPARYAQADAVVAPLKTRTGWLYRGRLSGYTQAEAAAACTYVNDCFPVAVK